MVVTPDSRIILLKSPLKLDNYNQITFNNSGDQFNYFYNLPKIEEWNYSYNRKDGVIRVSTDGTLDYEDLLHYNYCMYQNTHYDMKWFYAFVTGVKYVNDGMTEVSIETDVFQTWQFDIIYKQSFIERLHVIDDTIGLHTVPEKLEHGPYMIQTAGMIETALDSTYIVVDTTFIPDGMPGNPGHTFGGVYGGCYRLVFNSGSDVTKWIKACDQLAKADSIQSIFLAPQGIFGQITWSDGTPTGTDVGTIHVGTVAATYGSVRMRNDISLGLPSTISGYTPKNNKLFTYPYCCLSITNNAGQNAEYHFEDFLNNTANFYLDGVVCPGCSIKLYPTNYKHFSATEAIKAGYDFGLTAGKYPMCSWQSDPYTNWLTQQAVNNRMQIAGATMNIIGGLATGGEASISGAASIGSIINEYYTHALMPPQSHGTNSGDNNFGDKAFYTYYKFTIKQEYAKIIDDYFTMYGYQVNILGTPSIHTRSNWNFIKCVDVNLEGDIPEADMDKIRSLFNNGCTFWHTTSQFLNYSATNSIL